VQTRDGRQEMDVVGARTRLAHPVRHHLTRKVAMLLRSAVLCTSVLLLMSAPLSAQTRDNGNGLWLSGGAGGGLLRVTCVICRTDRRAGPALHISGGTTVRPGLLLGVDVGGWTRTADDIRTLLVSGMVSARIQPDPARGLFLKAGAGVVRFSLDEGELRSTLPGIVLGAGYDVPLGERYTVSNSVGLLASSFGTLRSGDGAVAEDVSISLLQLGISLARR
jgi:hypothetical protein